MSRRPLAVRDGRFRWVVEISVDATWVADGFDLTDKRALDMLASELRWANTETELGAKVLAAPDPEAIAIEQGYESAADRAAREDRG